MDRKLLMLDASGRMSHGTRANFVNLLSAGDLVVANDAATLPASLQGIHARSGEEIEVRLAGRRSVRTDDVRQFSAVVFGPGDFHTRTEDRPLPPPLIAGDQLVLGPLPATVERVLDHPRFVELRMEGSADEIWAKLARHGRPIQYSHVASRLALWDVWTPIGGPPVAFEPPSAGFLLDWGTLARMHELSIGFATITHAAGISSTGDPALDALLPFDEPYRILPSAAGAIARTKKNGGRVVAIGTTVVRALEHGASRDGTVRAGDGVATQRVGPWSRLCVVDAILTGIHEQGTSHFEMLRAFAGDTALVRANQELEKYGYRTHEFGDSMFVERRTKRAHGGCGTPAVAVPLLSEVNKGMLRNDDLGRNFYCR
jgi:S-adenosylmethionine:tRNA ribosyltransferase-isomerase